MINFERIKHDVNGNPRFRCALDSFASDIEAAKRIAKANGGRCTKRGFVFKRYEFQLPELSERLTAHLPTDGS